jgi:hypothetical protein
VTNSEMLEEFGNLLVDGTEDDIQERIKDIVCMSKEAIRLNEEIVSIFVELLGCGYSETDSSDNVTFMRYSNMIHEALINNVFDIDIYNEDIDRLSNDLFDAGIRPEDFFEKYKKYIKF